jgi:hypothetical protein
MPLPLTRRFRKMAWCRQPPSPCSLRRTGHRVTVPCWYFSGGQRLSLSPLASGANFTLFGADVRAWQGLLARLDFTAHAQSPHVLNNNITLDSITFSDVPIPEPSTFCLVGLGALTCSRVAVGLFHGEGVGQVPHFAHLAVGKQHFDDVEAELDRRVFQQPQIMQRGPGE